MPGGRGGGGGATAVVAVAEVMGAGGTTTGTVAGAVITPTETGVVVVVVGPLGARGFTRTIGMIEVALAETGEDGAVGIVAGVVASIEIVDFGDLACNAFVFKGDDAGGVNGALPPCSASTRLVSSSSSSSFNSGLTAFSSFRSLHISFQLLFPRA